jgi:hypothetical protein
MMQLSYDIVPYKSGWAMVIVPSNADSFATKQDAFDAAAEHTRKLRFAGYSLMIRPAEHRIGKRQNS